MQKRRIKYLDVLKFIGILFIYVGHYLDSAGLLYKFVFEFHVPLFFFISGCTENFNKESSLISGIYKKIKAILIPFFVFSCFSIVFRVLIYGGGLSFVKDSLILMLQGCVRNKYFASSLWFLTCLFMVSVLFQFIKRIKHKYLIFLFSLMIFAFVNLNVVEIPKYYNIKSALYYQLFYVLGYILFDEIDRILTSPKPMYRIIKIFTFLYSFAYTSLLFFQKNIYSILSTIKMVQWFFPVLTAMTAIWFFVILSYFLKNITLLSELGKATLYFCGSEYIIKRTVSSFISAFTDMQIHNGATALLWSFILLILVYKFLVPIETQILNSINKRIDNIFRKLFFHQNKILDSSKQ